MDKQQQQQFDIVQRGLDTVPIDKLTPKIEAVLRLKKEPLNSSQVLIVLLNVIVGILRDILEKDPPAAQKKEVEKMLEKCNEMVIQLAYSLGIHNDSSSVPKLTEKH